LKRHWFGNRRIRASYAFFCLVDVEATKKLLEQEQAAAMDPTPETDANIELRLYRWLKSYFEN